MVTMLPETALVLDTDRLTLMPYGAEDLDIACRILCDPQIMRYVTEPMTRAQVRAMMPDMQRRGAGGRLGMWCVRDRASGQKLGDAVLTPVPIEQTMTPWHQLVPEAYPPGPIELGYMLIQSAWGQGYATEICARLLRFAFQQTDLPQVVATIDPGNAASRHVLQKCGMQGQGLRRAYGTDQAEWFALTRADWDTRKETTS